MRLPKINRAYHTRAVEVDAEPERTLPEKNTGWYLSFVVSLVEGYRRLTRVGALPHSTLTDTL